MTEIEKTIRLIAADVDGTLVRDDRLMTRFTRDTICALHRHGILFGIASGRDYHQLLEDNRLWNFDFPFDFVIGMNGGQVYIEKEKKAYEYYLLSTSTLQKLLTMMAPLDLNPSMYIDPPDFMALRVDEGEMQSAERNHSNLIIAKDLSDFWQKPHAKVMYRINDPEKMNEAVAWADAHPSDLWHSVKTQTTMLEFMDPHVNKGMGLQKVSELLNVPLTGILAAGDMDNDVPMLKTAGYSVCMCNGCDEGKEAADAVTRMSNNDDGLALWLRTAFPDYLKSDE